MSQNAKKKKVLGYEYFSMGLYWYSAEQVYFETRMLVIFFFFSVWWGGLTSSLRSDLTSLAAV